MSFFLPRLYPIFDLPILVRLGQDKHPGNLRLQQLAEPFFAVGCEILQLRAKDSSPQEILDYAAAIHDARGNRDCTLILNDRPDLALLAGFDGCHLGQEDLSLAGARMILPRPKVLGLSTHNETQIEAGNATDADYIAIGPVFSTRSKADAEPALGLAEFARLRRLTSKPVVAIGGITRHNARSVVDAGADSVAIIGDLYLGCTLGNFASRLAENVADILAQIL
jgi:thiamine-phosphate pyrophosphorylase